MNQVGQGQETQRKDQFLTLMERLQEEEKRKPKDRNLKHGFYDRIFNGVAEVEKVGKVSLRLKRESGSPLGVLIVTPEIVKYAKKEDRLLAMLGQRNGQWHLIHIQMIASCLGTRNGMSDIHLSVSRWALGGAQP
jgi:hypothetical protein